MTTRFTLFCPFFCGLELCNVEGWGRTTGTAHDMIRMIHAESIDTLRKVFWRAFPHNLMLLPVDETDRSLECSIGIGPFHVPAGRREVAR